MKLLSANKMASTSLAAVLATFFVLSSFGTADARHRYRHRGGSVAAGIVAGAIIGGAIVAGSRNTRRYGRRHTHRHCHRNSRGRIYKCHTHRHNRRHHR